MGDCSAGLYHTCTCQIHKSIHSLNLSIAGVTIGDPVLRTGKPLSVELGPGNNFFIIFPPILFPIVC